MTYDSNEKRWLKGHTDEAPRGLTLPGALRSPASTASVRLNDNMALA
jgi:hypothetical protein